MSESWIVPEACTLPSADQPLRVAEFDGLFAEHLESVEQVGPTEARMALLGPEGLGVMVRDLADRETACCSFFEFSVSAEPSTEAGREAVQLEIRVPPTRADVLGALANRAASAKSGLHGD